ncbi:choice-of-anchor D domain-containing protein [Paraburkholderia sp. HD33-4]|uniref:choice-of-anchor D domain-containing protein n=1 Tax=Paraburkholderia sp. HD33-4 TaxID=2883242 RepID=UPI001F341B7D|nr:choice-of-anchor D domain-containing protein [Paraburkholderia sp. HD33-4]
MDPNDDQRVFIAYVTGTGASDDILHLRWSSDGGKNWSTDARSISVAKNPGVAINTLGMVGFVYQQVVGANWTTILEVSDNGFVSGFSSHTLASTPTNAPSPTPVMATYLGDYIKLQAVENDFYGIFSASNAPVKANFPSGVTYQRNVDWSTQTLLGNDGVTPVAVSIDPFFFKLTVRMPKVATAIANSGFFGDVCRESFVDEMLTVNNSGTGTLRIFNIASTSADFEVPAVLSWPLKVRPGVSVELPIRFKPVAHGSRSGKIEIFSNDPASPHVVDVSGECPSPRLSLVIADTGNLGRACIGSFVDRPLVLVNSGRCPLHVTGITVTGEFLAPEVLSWPVAVGPGDALSVPVRFQPLGFGHKTGTITVISNDPAGPRTVDVSGDSPSGRLVISGSTTFGGVHACCCADRTVVICNAGECALQVSSVQFRRKSRHWRMIHNPFPVALHPGACIPLVIQYRATEKYPRACELVIRSDDPAAPEKRIELLAYTIWDDCHREAREQCEDCRKGCCDRHRGESGCRQGYPCACEDNDDEESD